MKWHIQNGEAELNTYQQQLVERLAPVLDRIDDARVSASSGLAARKAGKKWELLLTVEARATGVPALMLAARPDQCILGFANSEILECHHDPGTDPGPVDEVVTLIERYLSGITVIESYNSRGRIVRTDYFYGLDSELAATSKIGSDSRLLVFPRRVARTVKRTFRFLRDDGAAEQEIGPDGQRHG
jgi:hypothetical protein